MINYPSGVEKQFVEAIERNGDLILNQAEDANDVEGQETEDSSSKEKGESSNSVLEISFHELNAVKP